MLPALLFSASSYSLDKVDVAKCAANNSDASRLICYDNLAKSLGVSGPKTRIEKGAGSWSVRVDKSPIDDSENVYMRVDSDNEIGSGYRTKRPSLHIRCAENKTNVFVTWGMYLGLNSTRMLTRFDDKKATTSSWYISTDNKAVFAKSDIPLAKSMMKYSKVLMQITPHSESPVMATFDISGLTEAIKPLRKSCNW